MKRFFALTLAAVLLLALFPGLRAEAATPAKAEDKAETEPTEKSKVEVPIEGEYTLFALEVKGMQLDPADFEASGQISLNRDGTGRMIFNGEEETLPKWTEKDGVLTLYDSGNTTQEAAIQDGIIEMEIIPAYFLYFAHKDADTEGFETGGHPTGSKLYAFYRSMNVEKGVRLRYQYHTDYMDTMSVVETHARGENFYELKTQRLMGYEQASATLYRDGIVYLLYPDKMTGSEVMPVSLSLLGGDVLQLDDLCKVIGSCFMRKDFTEEERELDGETWTVEVFPADETTEEAVFFYDRDGKLVHVLVGAPKLMPDLGETFYKI